MSDKSWRNTTYAFPFDDGEAICTGMTLRDYFAGQAMSGVANGYWSNPNMSGLSPHNIADEAYQLADAMLAARGEQ